MSRVKPAWYIIYYHNVSWEENCYLSSIGGTCPPDIFREQVGALDQAGELVSISEGLKRLEEGAIDRPIFSFWFDDGFAGVGQYACPILADYGTTGAVSICSRFVLRKEFFWRSKLSYLNSVDGLRFLRSQLKPFGYRFPQSVREFTLTAFSNEILEVIDDVYRRFSSAAQRDDAFRIFLDQHGVRALKRDGWDIANHTSGHYPVGIDGTLEQLANQHEECERDIEKICGAPSQYWVLPFDAKTSDQLLTKLQGIFGDRCYVLVRGQPNLTDSFKSSPSRVLYRFTAPTGSAQALMSTIQS